MSSERSASEIISSTTNSRHSFSTGIVDYFRSIGHAVPDRDYLAAMVGDSYQASHASKESNRSPTKYTAKDGVFEGLLESHQVVYNTILDEAIENVKALKVINGLLETPRRRRRSVDVTNEEEKQWATDMAKCARSQEAVFQRTVMISIIDRFKLDDQLDYMCEAPWISERFPCPPYSEDSLRHKARICKNRNCIICQPKPDLVVAFNSKSLVTDESLLRQLRISDLSGHIFPEGNGTDQTIRAFHFLSLEVKGKQGRIDNVIALRQNLNTASQALCNRYRCMLATNDVDRFFSHVRVFSAVATTEGFWLRVHRATKMKNASAANNKAYPLEFQFHSFRGLEKGYSKNAVSQIMGCILFEYGIQTLLPILKETVSSLLNSGPIESADLEVPDGLGEARVSSSSQGKRKANEMEGSLISDRDSRRRREDSSISSVT